MFNVSLFSRIKNIHGKLETLMATGTVLGMRVGGEIGNAIVVELVLAVVAVVGVHFIVFRPFMGVGVGYAVAGG